MSNPGSYSDAIYTTPAPAQSQELSTVMIVAYVLIYTALFACCCFVCVRFLLWDCVGCLSDTETVDLAVCEPDGVRVISSEPAIPSLQGELRGIVIVSSLAD